MKDDIEHSSNDSEERLTLPEPTTDIDTGSADPLKKVNLSSWPSFSSATFVTSGHSGI
jgi:hypothetical protein